MLLCVGIMMLLKKAYCDNNGNNSVTLTTAEPIGDIQMAMVTSPSGKKPQQSIWRY